MRVNHLKNPQNSMWKDLFRSNILLSATSSRDITHQGTLQNEKEKQQIALELVKKWSMDWLLKHNRREEIT